MWKRENNGGENNGGGIWWRQIEGSLCKKRQVNGGQINDGTEGVKTDLELDLLCFAKITSKSFKIITRALVLICPSLTCLHFPVYRISLGKQETE